MESGTSEARVEPTAQAQASSDSLDLRKDEEFWMDNGTIILIARGVGFRVYRGVLSSHSPVFADMFSLPQPAQSPSLSSLIPTSACPVVHVDDSPEDFRCILRALLPGKDERFVRDQPDYPTYDMISAYARLGHKYQIDHLLDQSLHYLKQHFTADFDRWYNRPVHKGGYVPPHFKPIHVIGVVNIARLAGCDTILPIALALCCSLNPEVLLRGFRRPDGSVEQLDHEDLIRCLVATPVLMQKTTCAVLRALRPTAKGSSGETVVTMCNSGA